MFDSWRRHIFDSWSDVRKNCGSYLSRAFIRAVWYPKTHSKTQNIKNMTLLTLKNLYHF
jgi:hypothetical protein